MPPRFTSEPAHAKENARLIVTRHYPYQPGLTYRCESPEKPRRLSGYAARFGVESGVLQDDDTNDGKPFVEVLARGCFARTLRDKPDVRALYNHDTSALLARTASGTLDLAEDDEGLKFDLELPNTSLGHDVGAMVARGDISGCSFGFAPVEDGWTRRPGKPDLRTVYDLVLFEISPAVAFPAYEATTVAVRSRRHAGTPATGPTRAALQRRAAMRRLIASF